MSATAANDRFEALERLCSVQSDDAAKCYGEFLSRRTLCHTIKYEVEVKNLPGGS